MISPLILERDGRWRMITTFLIFCLAGFPVAWLVCGSLSGQWMSTVVELQGGPFVQVLMRSLTQGLCVALCSFVLGWPFGSLLGLTRFPGKGFVSAMLLVPLLLPAFLWAIGLASLRTLFPYRYQYWLDGLPGCVLTFTVFALPLVAFSSMLRLRRLSRSQLDSLRVAGGTPLLLRAIVRYSMPAAATAAVLGGVLSLVDSGPGQIMGYHGVASDILIAFAARQDVALAATKALTLGVFLLPIAFPVAWWFARSLESELHGNDLGRTSLMRPSMGLLALTLAISAAALLVIVAPFIGLFRPLFFGSSQEAFKYAADALQESADTTLVYGIGAGLIATLSGLAVSFFASRQGKYRRAIFLLSIIALAFPPSIHALGIVQLVSAAPASLDFLLRSRGIVGLGLGLRFMPIAAILCLFGWSQFPRSIAHAAAVHGVPLPIYLFKVVLPAFMPTLLASALIIFLMALADVSTTQLLQPPGATAFTGRIFTVMDNASERHVAALCVVYLIVSLGALIPVSYFVKRLKFQSLSSNDCTAGN